MGASEIMLSSSGNAFNLSENFAITSLYKIKAVLYFASGLTVISLKTQIYYPMKNLVWCLAIYINKALSIYRYQIILCLRFYCYFLEQTVAFGIKSSLHRPVFLHDKLRFHHLFQYCYKSIRPIYKFSLLYILYNIILYSP